ncbi:MAG: ABC transporter substrate-binding protein, partial [Draconibacterium sp.]|nr:ABC transporter substrate-binding protein [Draconibacterium sp.]
MKFCKAIFSFMVGCIIVFMTFGRALNLPTQNNQKPPIKIGLLISNKNQTEARNGAELAVKEFNESGGFQGRKIELITRSMEGPWGTGTKQTVNLVFNEKVWAILGSHDGRNAHLVEQVIAKTHIPFVSAWSADPTLAQAYVPWFFNVVP